MLKYSDNTPESKRPAARNAGRMVIRRIIDNRLADDHPGDLEEARARGLRL